jgi:hypothetical protein
MKFCLTFAACDMIGTGLSYEAEIDIGVRIIAVTLGVLWFIWRAREYSRGT